MLVCCQMGSSSDEGQYQIQGSNVLVVVDAMLLHQDDGVLEYRGVTQKDLSFCRNNRSTAKLAQLCLGLCECCLCETDTAAIGSHSGW